MTIGQLITIYHLNMNNEISTKTKEAHINMREVHINFKKLLKQIERKIKYEKIYKKVN